MDKKIKDENNKNYIEKKPFYKRIWFWIVIVIILIIVFASIGSNNSSGKNSSSSSSSAITRTAKKKDTNKVTLTNFDKINVSGDSGSTKADVEKLFGKKPNSTSTSTIEGTTADLYTWNKVNGGSVGSNVVVYFSNDHAISKHITGIKVNRKNKITLGDFEQVQNGMTKDQIKDMFGKPNGYSVTNIAGVSSEHWYYTSNVQGDSGANFLIGFSGDTVNSKSQSNMSGNAINKQIAKIIKQFKNKQNESSSSSIDNSVATQSSSGQVNTTNVNQANTAISSVGNQQPQQNYSQQGSASATQQTQVSSGVNNADEAVAAAKAKYGDNGGTVHWGYMIDGTTGEPIRNPDGSYFVKGTADDGTMTGTQYSVNVSPDGTITSN